MGSSMGQRAYRSERTTSFEKAILGFTFTMRGHGTQTLSQCLKSAKEFDEKLQN